MPIKSINFNQNRHLSNYLPHLFIFLLLGLSISSLSAETLRIAVASNFLKTAQNLSRQFEAQSEHIIQISSGSSGKLFLQITHGAPFDLFLSADSQKPEELLKRGFAVAGTKQTYAIGKLSLWLKNCIQTSSILVLEDPTIKKIALANPKLAPYGLASKQLLEKHQLWTIVKSKLLFPENISQVTQLAKTGVIDAAFIANSHAGDLISDKRSCLINLPEMDYRPIEQQMILLSKSDKQATAREFIQFIHSKQAQDLIKNMGYIVPYSDKIGL